MARPSITVEQFFKEHAAALAMRLLAGGRGLKRVIREPTVNRPGLALSGFTQYFAYKRVQAFGHAEVYYLRSLTKAERAARYADFFAYKIPCIVFSRSLKPDRDFLAAAEMAGVPVFQSPLVTMKFINNATLELEMMFAPRGTEIGSMVDILGVGVMIRGDSGIGKSEAVLALIERGYSLVSDDVTKVTLVGGRDVLGTGSDLTRNHMEIRGIGIINVAAMFGVKSVRKEKTLDLVVTLKLWDEVA
ncbi:MAG TPA: HPr(Ser) kinase/phosphatase, partial [Candidatus Paceibacterota bacterium]|nr:HPr(Ser) kinase/phosphatase [Candidatus Paceibacterota bacterium]